MGTEDNKQIVRRFLEAFSQSRFDEALGMMSDNATWWVAGRFPLSGTKSKQEFQQLLGGIGGEINGHLSIAPKSFVAEGDRVAVEAESKADFKNGRKYNNQYHFLFEVRNGKIEAVREYLDTMHANDIMCTPVESKQAAE